MGDVLSQSQIDELLNSFSSVGSKAFENLQTETPEKKIKTYDFKMPKKFTKERLKTIGEIYDAYSRLLSTYLTGVTRLYCKVSVLQIEEQRYYEFNNALPDFTIIGTVDLGIENEDVLDTDCIMQLGNSLTFSLIDRLFGGSGSSVEINRDFTEIELGLLKKVLVRMAELLKEAWSNFMEIDPSLLKIETNPRATPAINIDEVIVLVTLEIEFALAKHVVTISVPAVGMESIMSKFSDKYTRNTKRFDAVKEQERREDILRGIRTTPLKIDVILAQTKIDISEILTLEVNDIIPLNVPITNNAVVKINDNLWFDGKLGVSGAKKAVKIDHVYKT
ncbi:MAG: flagellar motor switch protein FliM [Oscillospiraceae bacterium]